MSALNINDLILLFFRKPEQTISNPKLEKMRSALYVLRRDIFELFFASDGTELKEVQTPILSTIAVMVGLDILSQVYNKKFRKSNIRKLLKKTTSLEKSLINALSFYRNAVCHNYTMQTEGLKKQKTGKLRHILIKIGLVKKEMQDYTYTLIEAKASDPIRSQSDGSYVIYPRELYNLFNNIIDKVEQEVNNNPNAYKQVLEKFRMYTFSKKT